MNTIETEQILSGRVALVTGGARGIGLAVTRHLHALGASVVVADNGVSMGGESPSPTPAQTVVQELGARARAFTENLAVAEGAAEAVSLAVSSFGAIDLVVNNAAILRERFVFKADPASFDAVLANNLNAAFYVLAAATPHLREQARNGRPAGRIVNMTSSAGLYGNFGQAAYASSKAGLLGLTRVVAMDMARSGVTCNAIAPFAATRVTEAIVPANPEQAQYKARASKVPPRFVAELVGFLCGPEAQDVTGQLFGVRGRQVFLFSQPRPVEQFVSPAGGAGSPAFSGLFREHFQARFTSLDTDLEAFNSEPVLETSDD